MASLMLMEFRRSEHFLMKLSRNHRDWAFTLIELLLIIATLAILAALLLPKLARRGDTAQKINCSNNLKQIGISFRTWALDNNDKFPMQVPATNGGTLELVESGTVFSHFQVMSNELSTPKLLVCPQETDPKRTVANTFAITASSTASFTNDSQVSYFVGVDAEDVRPSTFLSGDRNVAFDGIPVKHGLHTVRTGSSLGWVQPQHNNGGNICFADGSVQGLSTRGLRAAFQATGVATNRFAVP